MFDGLAKVVLSLLRLLGEERFPDWLEKWYTGDFGGAWYLTAAEPTSLPNNNIVRARLARAL